MGHTEKQQQLSDSTTSMDKQEMCRVQDGNPQFVDMYLHPTSPQAPRTPVAEVNQRLLGTPDSSPGKQIHKKPAHQYHARSMLDALSLGHNGSPRAHTSIQNELQTATSSRRPAPANSGARPSSSPGYSFGGPIHRQQQAPSRSRGRASLEQPKHMWDVEYTRKPLGDPPMRELNPSAPSQQIRLKARAATLIQRYAGTNWQAAQRTKWMLDVVSHIDADYREYMLGQACEIQHLQQQIQQMQASHADELAGTQTQVAELEGLVMQQQSELRACAASNLDLHARLAEGQAALAVAEQAAGQAASDMYAFHQAVSAMTDHDMRARKHLANRSHALKDALRSSQSQLRHSTEMGRRHQLEVAAMLQMKNEEQARGQAALSAKLMGQLAAVHQVERAAAQVEVAKMKMELEAYKEPWTYAFGKRSPTKNEAVTKALAASHYEVLGVPRDASAEQIKAAYHTAALRLHPDKQQLGSSDAQHASAQPGLPGPAGQQHWSFLDIQRAYQVLRNPNMREVHDHELQLLDMRQHITFQDELGLADMQPEVHEGSPGYSYSCRCGDHYWLPQADVVAAVHQVVVPCRSCSNHILVDVRGANVPLPQQHDVQTSMPADPG